MLGILRHMDNSHPLDRLIPDPTGLEPLCSREEFDACTRELVQEDAPKVFAVVQEYGDRVDGAVVGWGMAFGDHVDIVTTDGSLRRLASPEVALKRMRYGAHVTTRLVWVAEPEEP